MSNRERKMQVGNSEPLVSVVIPVYNVEKYLRTCLDSVLAQSYKNMQVIVVNDGSPDGSLAIAESYADPRLEVVSKPNGGLSSARNFGLARAQGDYLCFVDSDDSLHPDFVRLLMEGISKLQADLAVCGLARFSKDSELYSMSQPAQEENWRLYSQNEAITQLYGGLLLQQLTVAVSKLYPRRIYKNLHFPEGRLHEDVAVALPVLLQSERVALTRAPLYHYRCNESSIMATPSWKHRDGIDFYEEHYRLLSDLHLPQAKLALLAAFKAGINCLTEYSANPSYRRDPRYRSLQKRVQKLARRIPLKGLRKIDAATVVTTRINIAVATFIYGIALRLK